MPAIDCSRSRLWLFVIELAVAAVLGVVPLFARPPMAHAQATRTWVSGTGDDVNPCSRTAACKTFAGAISKTAAGGEINVLDPGGFGAVTITKSITIDGTGTFASILDSSTTGVVINAAATDIITLRGLAIQGADAPGVPSPGVNGIRILKASNVFVENVVIENHSSFGIDVEPSASVDLYVTDTIIRHNGGSGIFVSPSTGFARVMVDGSRLEANAFGVFAGNNSRVTVRNSVLGSNTTAGLQAMAAAGTTAEANRETTTVTGNNVGVQSSGNGQPATVRLSNTTIVNNVTGISAPSPGAVVSFGNNRIGGNTTNGAPTSTPGQQ